MAHRYLFLAVLFAVCMQAEAAEPGFFNISHMNNNISQVNYSLLAGANALEMDLNFTKDGAPTDFRHGLPCDCTCTLGLSSICKAASSPCSKGTEAKRMFAYLASKPELALLIIDSKLSDIKRNAILAKAGANVFGLLKAELFRKGYQGQVVVSIPKRGQSPYLIGLQSAMAADEDFPAERVFFAIDMEDDATSTLTFMHELGLGSQIVYGTGVSTCSPKTYFKQIAVGSENLQQGIIGLNYIWTLDKASSMEKYLQRGATGIMSNNPEVVTKVAKARGLVFGRNSRIPQGNGNAPLPDRGF